MDNWFWTKVQRQCNGERTVSANVTETISHAQKLTLVRTSYPIQKITQKWTTGLNLKPKIQLLQVLLSLYLKIHRYNKNMICKTSNWQIRLHLKLIISTLLKILLIERKDIPQTRRKTLESMYLIKDLYLHKELSQFKKKKTQLKNLKCFKEILNQKQYRINKRAYEKMPGINSNHKNLELKNSMNKMNNIIESI